MTDDAETPADQVRLPDLEVIRRYSIAVRAEHAPLEEVVAALRADLERIEGARKPARQAPRSPARARPAPRRRR